GNRDPQAVLRGGERPRPDATVASDPVAPSHFSAPVSSPPTGLCGFRRLLLGIDDVCLSRRGSLRPEHQTAESIGESSGIPQSNKIDAQLYMSGSHAVLEGAWIDVTLFQPFSYFRDTYS